MSDALDQRIDALRAAFDEAFARPTRERDQQTEALLVVRVQGERLALRASRLRAVERDRRVVPLPQTSPPLVGVTAVRSQVVACYALGPYIGRPSANGPWLAVTAAHPDIGVVFDQVDAWKIVPQAALTPVEDAHRPFTRHVVEIDQSLCAVLDLDAILDHIRGATRPSETA